MPLYIAQRLTNKYYLQLHLKFTFSPNLHFLLKLTFSAVIHSTNKRLFLPSWHSLVLTVLLCVKLFNLRTGLFQPEDATFNFLLSKQLQKLLRSQLRFPFEWNFPHIWWCPSIHKLSPPPMNATFQLQCCQTCWIVDTWQLAIHTELQLTEDCFQCTAIQAEGPDVVSTLGTFRGSSCKIQ